VIDAGDIYLADLNEERRRHVLVVSNRRFTQLSGRVLAAPEIGEPDEVPFPWRVEVDGSVYAVDLLRSMPEARLLERTGRAPAAAMRAVHRTMVNIT